MLTGVVRSSRIVLSPSSWAPGKGQGEEEGDRVGHDDVVDDDVDDDDDDDDDGDVDENDIVDNLSGSRTGEICPPAPTPLEALTPDQTNVIGFSEGTKVYFEMYFLSVLYCFICILYCFILRKLYFLYLEL